MFDALIVELGVVAHHCYRCEVDRSQVGYFSMTSDREGLEGRLKGAASLGVSAQSHDSSLKSHSINTAFLYSLNYWEPTG